MRLIIAALLLIGCGSDDNKNKNPLSSSGMVSLEERNENVSVRGPITNGTTINEELISGRHAYYFQFNKMRDVDVILDGTDDIAYSLEKAIEGGKAVERLDTNDEDSDSPLAGYRDRSSKTYSLEKGSYFVVVRSVEDVDVVYRLRVSWR